MDGISAFAFFCEDVRREASGKETLIGVMADIMQFAAYPAQVRRLQVYFRIRFAVGKKYNQIIMPMLELDGKEVEASSPNEPFPLDMIERSLASAGKRKLPYITAAGRVRVTEPFPVQGPGQMRAILNVAGERMLCGVLTLTERATPSNET